MYNFFGYLVKENRMQRNCSLESLCSHTRPKTLIESIENGRIEPSKSMISELANLLNINYLDEVPKQDIQSIYSKFNYIFLDYNVHELSNFLEQFQHLKYSSLGPLIITLEILNESLYTDLPFDLDMLLQYEPYCTYEQLYYFYMSIGFIYEKIVFDYETSEKYYEKAYCYNRKGLSCYRIAMCYYASGDFFSAIDKFRPYLLFCINHNYIQIALNCCFYIANCYCELNCLHLMIKYYNQALGLSNNLHPETKYVIFHNIGVVYLYTNPAKAYEFLLKSEKYSSKNNLKLCGEIMLSCIMNANKEMAKIYFTKYKKLAENKNLHYSEYVQEVIDLCDLFFSNNDPYALEAYDEAAYNLYVKIRNSPQCECRNIILLQYKAYLSAKQNYKKALELSDEIAIFPKISFSVPSNYYLFSETK